MGNLASVFDIKALSEAISNIAEISDEVEHSCSNEIAESTRVYDQTVEEEKNKFEYAQCCKSGGSSSIDKYDGKRS